MVGTVKVDRYVCSLCGEDSISEDDIYWHIINEHDMDDLADFCIEKYTIEIEAEEVQTRL